MNYKPWLQKGNLTLVWLWSNSECPDSNETTPCPVSPTECILLWRHNGRGGVSNHRPHHGLLNRLFRCRSKKTWKLRVTGLFVGNSPETGEFPAQMASNAVNVSIWWRQHDIPIFKLIPQDKLKKSGKLRRTGGHHHWMTRPFLFCFVFK